MAGRVIRVTSPRDFSYDGLANSQFQKELVAEGIDCSGYDVADLVVRVHADTAIPSGAEVEVAVLSDARTADDPAQDFFTDPIGAITFDSNPAPIAGTFKLERINAPLGAMLAVRVGGSRETTAGNIRARLSIDLVLKSH